MLNMCWMTPGPHPHQFGFYMFGMGPSKFALISRTSVDFDVVVDYFVKNFMVGL